MVCSKFNTEKSCVISVVGFVMVWVFIWINGERSEKYKWDGCTTQRCECSAKTLSLSCSSSQKGLFSQQCTQSDFHIVYSPPPHHQSYADRIEMQLFMWLWQILRRTVASHSLQKKKSKTLLYLHYTASVCSFTYRVSNMKTTCSGKLFQNNQQKHFCCRFKSLYIPLQMLLLLTPNIRHCYTTTIIYYCYYYYCKKRQYNK